MKRTISADTEAAPSSPGRLIDAILDAWALGGQGTISTRSLARAASLPTTSIYHHFGDMDHLYLSAQDRARRLAEDWCSAALDQLKGANLLSPQALPGILAALIDEWSHGQRRLALAWRECGMLVYRDDRYQPALAAWDAMWSAFFDEFTDRCGQREFSEATCFFFDGESLLHLLGWRRMVDRAALDETCQGWASWLAGSLAQEGPWRRFARLEASVETAPVLVPHGAMERIAPAAANVVEQHGVAKLTHRAVAAEAGLSLGIVSHNVRTSAELARVAFETIYLRMMGSEDGVDRQGLALEGARHEGVESLVFGRPNGHTIAMQELLLAAIRQPEFHKFAPQLRYSRGRSSGDVFQALLGADAQTSALDAALFSSLLAGLRRASLGKSDEWSRTVSRRVLAPLLDGLVSHRS